jgi:hypothetical protein
MYFWYVILSNYCSKSNHSLINRKLPQMCVRMYIEGCVYIRMYDQIYVRRYVLYVCISFNIRTYVLVYTSKIYIWENTAYSTILPKLSVTIIWLSVKIGKQHRNSTMYSHYHITLIFVRITTALTNLQYVVYATDK